MNKIINLSIYTYLKINLIVLGVFVSIILSFYFLGNENVVGLFLTFFGLTTIFYGLLVLSILANLIANMVAGEYKKALVVLIFILISVLIFLFLIGLFGAVHIKYID